MDEYQRKMAILESFDRKLKKLENEELIMLALSELLSYHAAEQIPLFKAITIELNRRSKFDDQSPSPGLGEPCQRLVGNPIR